MGMLEASQQVFVESDLMYYEEAALDAIIEFLADSGEGVSCSCSNGGDKC